jgi:hypothetical protein
MNMGRESHIKRFSKSFILGIYLLTLVLGMSGLAEACAISGVLTPSAGENVGGSKLIQWSYYGSDCDTVTVSNIWYRYGSSWANAGYSGGTAVNTGSWLWDTSSNPDYDGAFIRVETFDGMSGTFAQSSGFNLDNADPTGGAVISPNGGESLQTSTTISWAAVSDAHYDHTVIEYSSDSGATWNSITTVTGGNSYVWDISALPTASTYLVRVTHYDDSANSVSDTSDAVFSVDSVAPNVVVSIGPAVVTDSDTITITYTVSGNEGNDVDFFWTTDDGVTTSPISCTASDCSASDSFTWAVSTGSQSSVNFKVVAKASDSTVPPNEGVALSNAVILDNAAPTNSAEDPASGETVPSLNPSVSITLSDAHSGIDSSTIVFRLVNTDTATVIADDISLSDSRLTYTAGSGILFFHDPSNIGVDGERLQATVDVDDAVGNSMMTKTWDFIVDTRTPVVTLNSPATGIWVSNPLQTMNFKINSIASATHTCELTVGGVTVQTLPSVAHNVNTDFPAVTLGQGTSTWNVKCTRNDNGLFGWGASRTIKVDSVAPTITNVVMTPADPSNDDTPLMTFSVRDANSGVNLGTVRVDDGYNSVFTDGDGNLVCSSVSGGYDCVLTYTAGEALADNDYNMVIDAADTVGNAATTYTVSAYTVDTVAPSSTDDAGSIDNVWLNVVPTVTVTWGDAVPSSGMAWMRYCLGAGCDPTVGTTFTSFSAFPQGTSVFRWTSRDSAGNTQGVNERTIKVDSVAPVISGVSILPADPTNDNTPVVTFSVDDTVSGVSVSTISVDDGVNSAFSDGDGFLSCVADGLGYDCALSYGASVALPDGDYSISIDANDNMGNVATTYTISAYTVDTVAPSSTDDAGSIDNVWLNVVPTVTVTWGDAVPSSGMAWMRYCLGAGCDPTVGTTFTSFSAFPQGTSVFRWTSRDSAGNTQVVNERLIKVDSVVPSITGVLIVPADPSKNNVPVISFSVEDATSGVDLTSIRVDDGANAAFADGDGFLTCTADGLGFDCAVVYGASVAFPDGDYNIAIDAKDKLGNSAFTYTINSYTVDTAKPTVTSGPAPADGVVVSDAGQVISIGLADSSSGIDTGSLRFTVEGVAYVFGVDPEVSWDGATLAFAQSVAFSDGQVVDVSVDAKDIAGNVMDTKIFSFTVDASAPVTASLSASPNSANTGSLITLSATSSDSVSVAGAMLVIDGGVSNITLTAANTGDGAFGGVSETLTYSLDTAAAGLVAGTHSFSIIGYDGFRWETVGTGNSGSFDLTTPPSGGGGGGGGGGHHQIPIEETIVVEEEGYTNPALRYAILDHFPSTFRSNVEPVVTDVSGAGEGAGGSELEETGGAVIEEEEGNLITGQAVSDLDGSAKGKFPWLLLLLIALLLAGGYVVWYYNDKSKDGK